MAENREMSQLKTEPPRKKIRLLIVDDSWILRRVLRGTLSQRDDVEIIGEATHGVEALDMVLKLSPDVILLDVEMPVMDGMTTLQHLMIQTPTPVVMLSGLSKRGTPRCFDALKYGAVDFVCKDSFFKGIDGTAHSKLVVSKVLAAADVKVSFIDPMQLRSDSRVLKRKKKVVFCEECGTRNSTWNTDNEPRVVQCKKCGDDISVVVKKRYMRMNYLTVIGAGASGYGNLLQIIPELTPDMAGSIFVMIHDKLENVKSFGKYLDAVSDFQVAVVGDGTAVESGYCYLFSTQQNVTLSPFSGQYSLKIDQEERRSEMGAIDNLMMSVASLLGDRTSGVLLSGKASDGSVGMKSILENKGNALLLNPDRCLYKNMVNRSAVSCKLQPGHDEKALAQRIKENHLLNKESVVTA